MMTNIIIIAIASAIWMAVAYWDNKKEKCLDLKTQIENTYDIKIHLGNCPFSKIDKDYVQTKSLDWKSLYEYLKVLNKVLEQYRYSVISQLPKDWCIFKKIINHHKGYAIYGETTWKNGKPLMIALNLSACIDEEDILDTVHHEIFHIISQDWTDEQYEEFLSVDSSFITSEYEGQPDEDAADSWAYGFYCSDSLKANFLHKKYAFLIK